MSDTISCPRCARATPIRRASCMYCGEQLPETEVSLQARVPIRREVEGWMPAFNVALLPTDQPRDVERQVARLAEVVGMEESLARVAIDSRIPIPVVRVADHVSAVDVSKLLTAVDLNPVVVADVDLALDRHPRRVRALYFEEDALTIVPLWGEPARLARDEVRIAILGHLVASRIDIVELAKQGKKRDMVDSSEIASEAFLVDLYGPTMEDAFRVRADVFDFSCLGERPAPYVEANVRRLGVWLAQYVGADRFDDGYRAISKLLSHSWPVEQRAESRGLMLKGDFKRYSVSRVESDPAAQFTRYSRLRFLLG